MEKTLKKAKKLNYETIIADIYVRNIPFRTLEEKFGFKDLFTWSFEYKNFLLMFKFLRNILGSRVYYFYFLILFLYFMLLKFILDVNIKYLLHTIILNFKIIFIM